MTIHVAMTSNAPPHLLIELHVARYTGLVRLAALLLGDAPPAGRHPLREPQSPREHRVRLVAELVELVPLPVECGWRSSWSSGGDHGFIVTRSTDSFRSDVRVEHRVVRVGAGGR